MGNELSTRLPVMIQAADAFVAELPNFVYLQSLGSTRFLKVAKVRSTEGTCVLKIFVHQDQSIALDERRQEVERIRSLLKAAANCCPYQRVIITSRACFLVRQCCKYTLFDRLTTRPYLEPVEKQWIAFQLMRALLQCHNAGVNHGDIKSQNVILNGWNWTMLTDFASYKPVNLPYDNPSDFAYFFDTSRRRTCYVAPERFDCSTEDPSSSNKHEHLNSAMDIFSAGCVLFELFTDGQAAFTFNQMLSFRRRKERGCDMRILEVLAENKALLHTIVPCLDRLPEHRPDIHQLLQACRVTLFPDVFYDFCWPYLESFTRQPLLTEDQIISRLDTDLEHIFRVLQRPEGTAADDCYLLFISLATAQMRGLKYVDSRLKALHILERFAAVAHDRIILDRMLPYLLYSLMDAQERVRARAVRALVRVLADVQQVPREDARVFQDYILPRLSKLTGDSSSLVRWSLARHMSELCGTAMRFVQSAAVHYQTCDPQVDDATTQPAVSDHEASRRKSSCEQRVRTDVRQLQDMMHEMLVNLLEDQDNSVKRALISHDLKSLCQFLGRQAALELVLSHMITFLNDKTDFNLRSTFYRSCTDAAVVVGWQSTLILKSLLQQGLCDAEETVVTSALLCCAQLAGHNLLQKVTIYELLADSVAFVVHPNASLRQACLEWLTAAAGCLNVADVHCKLLPLLSPYLVNQLITISCKELLVGNVSQPLPRAVWDLAVRYPSTTELMDFLYDKHLLTKLTPLTSHSAPALAELSITLPENRTLATLYQKMRNHGLNDYNEVHLLAFKDILLKMRKRVKQSDSDEFSRLAGGPGTVELPVDISRKQADLTIHRKDQDQRLRLLAAHKEARQQKKVEMQLQSAMNDDWAAMFGPAGQAAQPDTPDEPAPTLKLQGVPEVVLSDAASLAASTSNTIVSGSSLAQLDADESSSDTTAFAVVDTSSAMQSVGRMAACRESLASLIEHKRERWHRTARYKAHGSKQPRPVPGQRPRAALIAHCHEHAANVRRLCVHRSQRLFASASYDGSVKLWDARNIESLASVYRSSLTYTGLNSRVRAVQFMASRPQQLVCAGYGSELHVVNFEHKRASSQTAQVLCVEAERHGFVLDLATWHDGWSDVVAAATHHGQLLLWDTRAGSRPVGEWAAGNEHGLVTAFCVDHSRQHWAAMATAQGRILLWDLRFNLVVNQCQHAVERCIQGVWPAANSVSSVWAAYVGNGELSCWDMESAQRTLALWPSHTAPLSYSQTSTLCQTAVHCLPQQQALVTGDSDGTLLYWDTLHPQHSALLSARGYNREQQTTSFKVPMGSLMGAAASGTEFGSSVVDGCAVQTARTPRHSHNQQQLQPSTWHHDAVTDVKTLHTGQQQLMLTSSRDGAIKVWL